MAWLKEWRYRVICIHIEDFIVLFFFPQSHWIILSLAQGKSSLSKLRKTFWDYL